MKLFQSAVLCVGLDLHGHVVNLLIEGHRPYFLTKLTLIDNFPRSN